MDMIGGHTFLMFFIFIIQNHSSDKKKERNERVRITVYFTSVRVRSSERDPTTQIISLFFQLGLGIYAGSRVEEPVGTNLLLVLVFGM